MGEQRYERDEDEAERYDRQWHELLHELRLAQTGTQILFAFLLAITFTTPFRNSDSYTHVVFAGTLIVTAMATGLLLAPVSFHRLVFRRGVRDRMVTIAARMATGGLSLLLLAICGGVLLALDTVIYRGAAIAVALGALMWFVVFWHIVPAWVRRKG